MKTMTTHRWLALATLAAAVGLAVYVSRPALAQDGAGHPPIALFRDLLGLIKQFDEVASSSSAAGIAAVMGTEDHFKGKPEERAKYLEGLLPKVEDKAVQRTIRITLADTYKKMGKSEKALDHLEKVIIGKPGAN